MSQSAKAPKIHGSPDWFYFDQPPDPNHLADLLSVLVSFFLPPQLHSEDSQNGEVMRMKMMIEEKVVVAAQSVRSMICGHLKVKTLLNGYPYSIGQDLRTKSQREFAILLGESYHGI